MRDKVFSRLEAPRRNYVRTMINNMDSLYPIIPALGPIPKNASNHKSNPYGASLIVRHYSQIMPKHFDISPNFQIVKFNIIEGGVFDYKTLWAQTIFETRHTEIDHTTDKQDLEREPATAQ